MPGKMITKTVFACSAMLLVLLFSAFTAQAQVWTVENGDSIQEAIDSASNGDTLQVEPGTYVEFIDVNKVLRIEGTGDGVVLRAPAGGESLVEVPAPNVTLKGLTFEGVEWSNTGVDIYGNTWNVQVRNCTFRNLQTGIMIYSESMHVLVANNTFENVRDYGIDSEGPDPTEPYFRVLSIGNRFIFDSGADSSWKAHYAASRLGNIAFFNTFEDYEGHWALYTPDADDYLLNATDNYWGEDAEDPDIDAACSAKVLYAPWSFADAAGHADYQNVPLDESAVFDVGASEGITISLALAEPTAAFSTSLPLALAAYGDESPCPTTVQEDNPGADSYTAYFTLKNVEPGPVIAGSPIRMTAEFPKDAIGDEADLDDLAFYIYENGTWVDITNEEGITVEVDGDVVRLVIDELGDPGPIAITAGDGDSSSSSGCSATGAASLGLLFLAPFALAFRRKP